MKFSYTTHGLKRVKERLPWRDQYTMRNLLSLAWASKEKSPTLLFLRKRTSFNRYLKYRLFNKNIFVFNYHRPYKSEEKVVLVTCFPMRSVEETQARTDFKRWLNS